MITFFLTILFYKCPFREVFTVKKHFIGTFSSNWRPFSLALENFTTVFYFAVYSLILIWYAWVAMCMSNIGVRFLTISQWHDFYRQKQNVDVKYKEVLRLLNFFSEVWEFTFNRHIFHQICGTWWPNGVCFRKYHQVNK